MSKDNKKIEDNLIQSSTRSQLSELDKYKTKIVDKKIENNKMFSLVSGAVAAMSATTVMSNILIENYATVIQNTGTLLAMVVYSLGNYLMYKKAKEEKQIILADPQQEINVINMLKNKLDLLKVRLAQRKLQQATMATAGTGFIGSFVASFFMQPTNIEGINTLAIFGAAMAGAVGACSVATAIREKKNIEYYQTEIADTEKQIKEEQEKQQPNEELKGQQMTLK